MNQATARVLLAWAYGGSAFGQLAQTPPSFEVASIRPNNSIPAAARAALSSGSGVRLRTDPLRISGSLVTLKNVTLSELLHIAYSLPANNREEYQISGSPAWALPGGDYYDVQARAAGDVSPSIDQARLMLQTLMTQRFQLRFHRESKETQVYELAIGKSGLKMKQLPAPPWQSVVYPRVRYSIQQIDVMISKSLDRPLVDKTGLSGFFEFTNWSDADLVDTSMFTLAQERLGLKLNAAKEPMEIIVIDHVEKPSEN